MCRLVKKIALRTKGGLGRQLDGEGGLIGKFSKKIGLEYISKCLNLARFFASKGLSSYSLIFSVNNIIRSI